MDETTEQPPLTRLTFVALALSTAIVGIVINRAGNGLQLDTRDVLGDGLWAAMIAWWVGVLAPRASIWQRASFVVALCVAVELSQLYHDPAIDSVRSTLLGGLILGSDFDSRDLVSYAVGVTAAVGFESALRRRRRHAIVPVAADETLVEDSVVTPIEMPAPRTVYLEVTQDAGRKFFTRGVTGPIVMLNLLRFREVADYSASPSLAPAEPISGSEAYEKYVAHTLPFLKEAGGEVLFLGRATEFLIGPADERWDMVMLVRHRSAQTFLAFASNESYMGGMGHRLAAIEDSRLLPIIESS